MCIRDRGMATNMAPHNMREVAAGARHLVLNPEATLEAVSYTHLDVYKRQRPG